MVIPSLADYLRTVVKKDQLLAEIQTGAQKAGLSEITEDEIESEILAYRRRRSKNNK